MAVASLIFSFISQKLTGKGVAFVCLVLGVGAFLAIGIPNLLRTRRLAGQASAPGSLRMINTAETTYADRYKSGYSPTLAALGPPTGGSAESASAAGLIDEILALGHKSGYFFTYKVTAVDDKGFPSAYSINADPDPADPDFAGGNHYFTDDSGVIRSEQDHPANQDSPPLAG